MNGSAGSKLAGVLRDNYGFLIGGGRGWAYRGALLLQSYRMERVQLRNLKWGCGWLNQLETMVSLTVAHSFHPVFLLRIFPNYLSFGEKKSNKKKTFHAAHLPMSVIVPYICFIYAKGFK